MEKVKLLLALLFGVFTAVNAQTSYIHVDQFGYQKNASKVAVLVDPYVGFNAADSYTPSTIIEVRDSVTDAVVFSGSPVAWNSGQQHVVSGDIGWWFDFSTVTANGTYYVHDAPNNMSSPFFVIEEEPYREVLRAATKAFYYNRSGFAKTGPAAELWTDGMSFNNALQDANCRAITDPGNASLEKDLSGGWFDNGDYNKRVSTAYFAVHSLLSSYQRSPELFTDNWNWPESGNGVPDLLDEVKWELDWILKMANSDGSVHVKMGNENYSDNTSSPPSANTDPRFYGPTCSAASIAAASMLAHGAVVFADFPSMQTYANQLLTQAETCYNYGVAFFNNNNFDLDCDDGSIIGGDTDWDVTNQVQGLLSATVYLYGATGTESYQTFLINNGYLVSPLENNYWSPNELPICDALIYYSKLQGANTGMQGSVFSSASTSVSNNWGGFYGMTDAELYRDYMPTWAYYTGSNGRKAAYGAINVALANWGVGDSSDLWDKGASVLHSLHGVNPIGIVYLSNMSGFGADKSVNEIYHSWFADGTVYDNAQTSPIGPPPGYMPGGPNPYFSVSTLTPPYGQPAYKSYLDFNDNWPNNSWEVSEPEIAYQAMYVRLLSEIIGTEHAMLQVKENEVASFRIYPNPTEDNIFIQSDADVTFVEVFDLLGNSVVKTFSPLNNKIDVSELSSGIYVVRIHSAAGIFSARFEKM